MLKANFLAALSIFVSCLVLVLLVDIYGFFAFWKKW